MPFYAMPTEADLSYIAYRGIADNYLNELATQINREPDVITSCMVKSCIRSSLQNSIYTQVFYDTLNTPRAVFGMSPSGAVTYVETKGLDPMTRAKWARASVDLFKNLRHATGLKPWCYSDSRNNKASRLLTWFKFKRVPEKDVMINGVLFYYYEHQLPVAES